MRLSVLLKTGILKSLYYNFKFCKFSDAIRLPIVVARNATIRGRSKSFLFEEHPGWGGVTLGFNRDYNSGAPSSIVNYGTIIIHGRSHHSFGAGCSVLVKQGATLEIENNFGCTGDTRVWVHKLVRIGQNNLWSFGCTVLDGDDHQIFNTQIKRINEDKPITFGGDVWMGCNCTVLKGAVIPSNSIVAAGSLLTSIPIKEGGCIITSGGHILKRNVSWKQ